MAKIEIPDRWWTAPAVSESGQPILVTGLSGLEQFRQTGVYNFCVVVEWPYAPTPDGMPDDDTATLMEQATDALLAEFTRDPVAVMAGIDTGDGRREYTFYTRSLHIFQRKINDILAPLPPLPLGFSAFDDPEWQRYDDIMACEVECD